MNLNLKTKQYKEFTTWMMKLLTPSSPSAEMVTLGLFALEVAKMNLKCPDCSPYWPSAGWLCLPSNLCQMFTMSAYQQQKVGGRCQLSAAEKKQYHLLRCCSLSLNKGASCCHTQQGSECVNTETNTPDRWGIKPGLPSQAS